METEPNVCSIYGLSSQSTVVYFVNAGEFLTTQLLNV